MKKESNVYVGGENLLCVHFVVKLGHTKGNRTLEGGNMLVYHAVSDVFLGGVCLQV